MARARKRKHDPTMPRHIDQTKSPLGIYWQKQGEGRWYVFARIARASGISWTHLRSLVRGEKQMHVFILSELSEARGFDDACQRLRSVLEHCGQRWRDDAEQQIPR